MGVRSVCLGLYRPELKRHVQFGHPRTLNEFISLAMEMKVLSMVMVKKRLCQNH